MSLTARLHLVPALAGLAAALAVAVQAAPCRAEPPPAGASPPRARAYRLVLGSGYDVGFTRGGEVGLPDGSTQSLGAGAGLVVSGGLAVPVTADRLTEVQATIGWKSNLVGTSQSGLRYHAVPLELLVARSMAPLRLAAGLSCLLGPRYQGDGVAAFRSRELQPALGLVAQVELTALDPVTGLRSALGLRLTWQSLLSKGVGVGTDASTIGMTAGVAF